jgi:L-alanine-DL-glutamate epimerase-like enolase superfamily enzyme
MREVTGMASGRRIAASKPPLPPDGTQLPLAEAAGRGGDTSADRAYATIEFALCDIIGKACNQPLYRLWGPVSDHITPYAAVATRCCGLADIGKIHGKNVAAESLLHQFARMHQHRVRYGPATLPPCKVSVRRPGPAISSASARVAPSGHSQ